MESHEAAAARGLRRREALHPGYRPWQQRIAVVPDGDFFAALREGKASIVTDTIETFTEKGIKVSSGEEIPADVVVTATGFNLSVLGDVAFTVDGEPVDFTERVTWRGMMINDVPNMAYVFGYFRHSWTLRIDLVSDLVTRLLETMRDKGATVVTPTLRDRGRRTCNGGRGRTRRTSTPATSCARSTSCTSRATTSRGRTCRSTRRNASSCQGRPRRRHARLPLIRVGSTVAQGRAAFERGAWAEACALLGEAPEADADVEDVERLAVAAHLAGRDHDSECAWVRAHRERLRLDHTDDAVRCAFWLAILLMLRGETARAGGWLAGAERLVDEAGCGRGYLRVPVFLAALTDGDGVAAEALAREVVEVAQRCGDEDLRALGVLGQGQAALVLGELGRAMDLLDEVMVLVTTTPRSPIVTGIVYCAVIEACMDAADLRRAAEWTRALERWCAAQPDLVPYRGQCLVHRAQVLQARGNWPDALAEAGRPAQAGRSPAPGARARALPTGRAAPAARRAGRRRTVVPRGGPRGPGARTGVRAAAAGAGGPSRPRAPRCDGSSRRAGAGSTGRCCWRRRWRSTWPRATRPPPRTRAVS